MMSRAFVTSDREGLLSYLDNLVIDQTQVAQDIRNNSKRAFAMGVAEGIRLARLAVEHWPEVVNVLDGPPAQPVPKHSSGYDKHEYQPDFEKSWNPCKVCGFHRNSGVHI